MTPPFPATPVPAYYAHVTPSTRCGIYYGPTPTPSFTLSQSGATAYTVRNFDGTVVSTGAVSGTTVAPATPSGGWKYGWYRLYLTGPTNDAVFATGYGSYNFLVIRNDSRFVPNPAPGTSGGYVGSFISADDVVRGVAVLGPERWAVNSANNPTSGTVDAGNLPTLQAVTGIAVSKTYYSANAYQDTNRPRPLLVSFPQGAVDRALLLNGGGNTAWAVYCKDGTVDGSQVSVEVVTGTAASTSKLNVYFPNNTTLVESFDNIPQNLPVIDVSTSTSNYIRAFNRGATGLPVNVTPTAIGRAYYTGVGTTVTALYPDVLWYEGPINEPDQNGMQGAETAQAMKVFQASVHAGNAGAKALGPNFASVASNYTASGNLWDTFFAAGGGANCDGISFHAYGAGNGDLSALRANLGTFAALIAKYGLSAKPLWQTEQGVFTPVFGVYHPRRARWSMLQILLQEANGIPKEQSHLWYATSHGFWGQPAWWENGDGSLNPQVSLLRTFSEEVFGKTFLSQLDFGTLGNALYFGGLWRNPTDNTRVLVIQAASKVTGATLTLNVTGATGTLTTVDAFGNTGTATISGGKITLTPSDVPSYVELPAGASVAVAQIHDWAATSAPNIANGYTLAAATATTMVDQVWRIGNAYDGRGDPYKGTAALPDTATVQFRDPQRFDRVLIWSAVPWQPWSALTDFDVQTSTNGAAWTTQATVTVTPPASIAHGSDANGPGCTIETYWDERSIFDVKLPAPVSAKYVRLNVRATSYGGEPDAAAFAAGGQSGSPVVTVQQIAVRCDDQILTPRYLH